MAKGWIVFRILGALVLIGLLAGAGVMLYQAGQAQGYALGAAAGGKELSAPGVGVVAPGMAPWMYYRPHFMFGGPLVGLLFLCGLPLLFFFVLGGVFRRAMWHRHGPWGHGPWEHGPWGHGPWGHGPWQQPGQPQQPPQAQQPPASPQQPSA